jgi:hypothetical protein
MKLFNSRMFKRLIVLSFVILMISVSGCTTTTSKSGTPQNHASLPNGFERMVGSSQHSFIEWVDQYDSGNIGGYINIYKINVPNDNTTCYVTRVYNGGGISCLRNQ